MKSLNELFYDVILLNELGGNKSAALKFSDPDGASGRSGWSFGLCQFDTRHNDTALKCLAECGFTQDEIDGIVAQTVGVKTYSSRLAEHADIIEKYDTQQLSYCLNKALEFNVSHGIIMVDPTALLAVADYMNQYGSEGGGIAAYFNDIDVNRPVVGQDVQDFKLTRTKYGREHAADCNRRYANIVKVVSENVA